MIGPAGPERARGRTGRGAGFEWSVGVATRKDPTIPGQDPAASRDVADLQDRRDRDVLSRIANGSEEAFSELFRRYAPAAGGIAMRVIGDAAMAEEVVQEVMVSVWRRAGGYDPARGSVRSWLLAQAHHRAVDVVRREEASRRRASALAPMPAGDDPIEDVVEEGWLASRRARVRAALGELSHDQRRVLELAYYGGLTQSQVAHAAGIPLGTVKSRTLAAMNKLRSMLGGEGA